ncbi:hypothetical protein [Nocardiopsis sp. ATB16-24]|uniref:hypothetical protein n=1 Tax=Nocardiopsis sp. ATB16-24 TaxID=3019555 RepID=UPI0025558F51|nr:hypothetical protein [Nocardiopsis sp. ATB16-24]
MTPVGLYSISVRGLSVPDLLAWAHTHDMGFVHLRGGPRGFDLARRDSGELLGWCEAARETVPITGVTADVDLAHVYGTDSRQRHQAREELAALAAAAKVLGAGWVRLLACHPLTDLVGEPVEVSLPLVVELHHPGWLETGPQRALGDLLTHHGVSLLADTTQLARALANGGDGAMDRLERLWPHTRVLHLSDDGSGLADTTHTLVARRVAERIHDGQTVEVALEWTGPERTPHTCARLHRSHTAWWNHIDRETP